MKISYIFEAVGFIIIIIVCLALRALWLYEKKINFLYKERDKKIEEEKERMKGRLTGILEAKIKNLEEEYNPKIEELERKRRFILEKLPFIKK